MQFWKMLKNIKNKKHFLLLIKQLFKLNTVVFNFLHLTYFSHACNTFFLQVYILMCRSIRLCAQKMNFCFQKSKNSRKSILYIVNWMNCTKVLMTERNIYLQSTLALTLLYTIFLKNIISRAIFKMHMFWKFHFLPAILYTMRLYKFFKIIKFDTESL